MPLCCRLLSAAAVALSTSACTDRPEIVGTIVITNVEVIDGTGALPRSDETVLIQGSRIVSVGASVNVDVPPHATQVDGRGKFLMPGLLDMHMHFSLLGGPAILPLFTANSMTGVRDNGTDDRAALNAMLQR